MAPATFFVRPLDRRTIEHHESLRAQRLVVDTEDESDALRFDALLRCRSVWSSLIDKLETHIEAGLVEEDDVVDLERWEVIEDRGYLRRKVEEEDRTLRKARARWQRRDLVGKAKSERTSDDGTGPDGSEVDEDAWSDTSDDDLAIKATPQVERQRSSPVREAPLSAAYKRTQRRRMEELEDLRSFLHQEMALRLQRPSTPHTQDDEPPDLESALGGAESGTCNSLFDDLPLSGDLSDDDLDLMAVSAPDVMVTGKVEDPVTEGPGLSDFASGPTSSDPELLNNHKKEESLPPLPPATSAPPSRTNQPSPGSHPASDRHPPSPSSLVAVTPPRRPKFTFRGVVIPAFKREDNQPHLPPPPSVKRSPARGLPASETTQMGSSAPRLAAQEESLVWGSPSKRRRASSVAKVPSDADASETDELNLLPPSPSKRGRLTPATGFYRSPVTVTSSSEESPSQIHLPDTGAESDDEIDEIDFLTPSRRRDGHLAGLPSPKRPLEPFMTRVRQSLSSTRLS